jgi:hypothetical protein
VASRGARRVAHAQRDYLPLTADGLAAHLSGQAPADGMGNLITASLYGKAYRNGATVFLDSRPGGRDRRTLERCGSRRTTTLPSRS